MCEDLDRLPKDSQPMVETPDAKPTEIVEPEQLTNAEMAELKFCPKCTQLQGQVRQLQRKVDQLTIRLARSEGTKPTIYDK